VRGKTGYVPFWPGGLEGVSKTASNEELEEKGFRSVPPGFSRGLTLPGEVTEDEKSLLFQGSTQAVQNEEDVSRYNMIVNPQPDVFPGGPSVEIFGG